MRFAENVRFAEDVVFQFESYPLSARTVLAPEELYHYVMQEKSLTHVFNAGAKRMDKVDAHLLVLHEVLERWDRRGDVYKRQVLVESGGAPRADGAL